MEGMVSLNEKQVGEVLLLELKGRLDAVSTPDIEKKVFDHIKHGKYKLILDFTGVDYISSAGMRMLLSTTKKLKGLSGHLVLCSITTNVMDVFKMSGFDHVLELSSSKEEALKRF
ncbi:Anti-sigma factor antagonist [Chlamydiales bacterium STE3]|nr:Anti-sigma factor antagonist [Chlamydiales bacterium STE3]